MEVLTECGRASDAQLWRNWEPNGVYSSDGGEDASAVGQIGQLFFAIELTQLATGRTFITKWAWTVIPVGLWAALQICTALGL